MTDIFILDADDFYLKSITKKLTDQGLSVHTCSDWAVAVDEIKKTKPGIVVLERRSGSMRSSLIVQMSEELLMDSCRIFLSNDLHLDEMDEMIAHSLGFEKIIDRPLCEKELKEIFPEYYQENSEEEFKKAA